MRRRGIAHALRPVLFPTSTPTVAAEAPQLPSVLLPPTGNLRSAPLTITRVAHDTVLIDFDGDNVLTDPWFTDTEEYHHGEPLGFTVSQLSRLTAVVVSHAHFDHFDMKAFAAYPDKTVPFFVVPEWLRRPENPASQMYMK